MCQELNRTERKARKPHTCIWCGERIAAGERYLDVRVVNDDAGCVDTQHWHPECEDDLHAVVRAQGGGCYYFSAGENPRPSPRAA